MKLEDQVVSLELSKKLKELGVPQESLFWWAEYRHKINQPKFQWEVTDSTYEGDYCEYKNKVSAYTVAELGEMLPLVVSQNGEDHYLNCFRPCQWIEAQDKSLGWMIGYENGVFTHDEVEIQEAPTEADARAKMLIYLLENNLIEV